MKKRRTDVLTYKQIPLGSEMELDGEFVKIFDISENFTYDYHGIPIELEIAHGYRKIAPKFFNENDELDVIKYSTTIEDLEKNEKNKQLIEFIESRMNKRTADEYITKEKERVEEYIKRVQKLYDELYEAAGKSGNKRIIKELEEIDELYYCEAEPLLGKIEKRISKMSSAISIKTYKALKEIRKENPIICKE